MFVSSKNCLWEYFEEQLVSKDARGHGVNVTLLNPSRQNLL